MAARQRAQNLISAQILKTKYDVRNTAC